MKHFKRNHNEWSNPFKPGTPFHKKTGFLITLAALLLCTIQPAVTGDYQPLCHWTFDVSRDSLAFDSSSGKIDSISGYFGSEKGVHGRCLKLDGYTTALIRKSKDLSRLNEAFTIEAWLALQTLPWNWSAIVNQGNKRRADKVANGDDEIRFFLGINAFGKVGMKIHIDGDIHECISKQALPLLKWTHICATYNHETGIHIYLNGIQEGFLPLKGSVTSIRDQALWIGKSIQRMGAAGSEREASAGLAVDMVLDGLLDEVKIYNRALSREEINLSFMNNLPEEVQALDYRVMPSGPRDLPERFDAYHTRLRYSEEWEKFWRAGDYPDILLHFDELPVRLIFWRGTGYGGVWVSENGRWMGDQSLERAGAGKSPWGCSEHMSDKQCRYSRVRIVEKNDARIVIEWRYAISDITYDIFGTDRGDGWGEWALERYVIYPDGVSTRYQILWTDYLSHEWQETIVLNQPGTRPEDNIELDALSLANMQGDSRRFSWREGPPESFRGIDKPNIQLTHLKSKYKPFIIFEPEPHIKPFRGAIRPEYSHFPWWNHWPVAQIPNDGRRAFAADRPSHSSLSQSIEESAAIHKQEDGSFRAVSLTGMTDKSIPWLVSLARSWNHAPSLKVNNLGYVDAHYDKYQRAYVLNNISADDSVALNFTLNGGKDSPVVNTAFVILNWGEDEAALSIDGKKVERGSAFRFGHRARPSGIDLIIWIRGEYQKPVHFTLRRLAELSK